MYYSYQNLNDRPKGALKPCGPLWRHGRAWLHLGNGARRK